MNDNRKFLGIKTQLIDLLTIGMPLAIIAAYLQITTATCLRYIKTIRESGEWNKEGAPFLKGIKDALRQFTFIKQRKIRVEGIELQKLQDVIEDVLSFNRIIEILTISMNSIHKLTFSEFYPDVPKGYQDFIRTIFRESERGHGLSNTETRLVFFNYLASEKNFKIGNTMNTWFYPMIDDIVSEKARDLRDSVKPTFGVNIVERVEYMLSTLYEKDALVLEKYFGLGVEKVSLEEIADSENLTKTRVNQILERALRRCRANERIKMLFNPVPPPPPPSTKTTIESLDFSIRAINVLRDADIKTLEELTQFTKSDLLKFRNMGKKSMTEIEEILESRNLKFQKD